MNALSPILPHATLSQVQLYALRDQIDALIDKDRVAYASGNRCVTHRSGRRIYRHEAEETLAFHRQAICSAHSSIGLKAAATRIARHLADAMELAWPTIEDTQ